MLKKEIVELRIWDLKSTQYINETKKNKLKNKIKEEGFDYDKGYIFVSKNNVIIDGNHRYHALRELKGVTFKIKVKKTVLTKRVYIIKITFFIITLIYLTYLLFS